MALTIQTLAAALPGLSLSEPIPGLKGGKSIRIIPATVCQLGDETCPVRPNFQLGSFEESDRKNLDLVADDDLQQMGHDWDEWVIEACSQVTPPLFKKHHTPEELRTKYVPSVKHPEKYRPTFRTKVQTTGARKVRLWDRETRAPLTLEDIPDWQQCECQIRVVPKIWIQSNAFGTCWEAIDIMTAPPSQECPF